jgi:hypothetical protein
VKKKITLSNQRAKLDERRAFMKKHSTEKKLMIAKFMAFSVIKEFSSSFS